MQTSPCTPCCSDPQVTEVPGPDGAAGQDGSDGVDAFTTTTSATTVPAVGANVTAAVADSSMFAYGGYVVMGNTGASSGPATFQVVGIPTETSLTLTFKGYPADVEVGTILASGSKVVAAGQWGLPTPLKVYGAGSAYVLTTSYAAIDLGTTDPSVIITTAGTYLIFCRLVLAAAAASIAAETASVKLYRTNNTAGDVSNTEMTYDLPVMTLLTMTIGVVELQPIVYTTTNSTDILSLYGKVSADPTGDITVTEASIVAVRLY